MNNIDSFNIYPRMNHRYLLGEEILIDWLSGKKEKIDTKPTIKQEGKMKGRMTFKEAKKIKMPKAYISSRYQGIRD